MVDLGSVRALCSFPSLVEAQLEIERSIRRLAQSISSFLLGDLQARYGTNEALTDPTPPVWNDVMIYCREELDGDWPCLRPCCPLCTKSQPLSCSRAIMGAFVTCNVRQHFERRAANTSERPGM